MTSLTRYENEGLEFYIDIEGAVFATQRGLARMCDAAESTVRSWMTARKIKGFKAKALVLQEFKSERKEIERSVVLYDEMTMSRALHHFNIERSVLWSAIGIRATAQKITGWQKPVEAPQYRLSPKPGSPKNHYYQISSEKEMELAQAISLRMAVFADAMDIVFLYRPDNGSGFSTLDFIDLAGAIHGKASRQCTFYGSSEDLDGRAKIQRIVEDEINQAKEAGLESSTAILGINNENIPLPKLQAVLKSSIKSLPSA